MLFSDCLATDQSVIDFRLNCLHIDWIVLLKHLNFLYAGLIDPGCKGQATIDFKHYFPRQLDLAVTSGNANQLCLEPTC